MIGCFFDAAVIGVGVQNFYIKFYPEWDDWNDKEAANMNFMTRSDKQKRGVCIMVFRSIIHFKIM